MRSYQACPQLLSFRPPMIVVHYIPQRTGPMFSEGPEQVNLWQLKLKYMAKILLHAQSNTHS